MPCHLTFAAVQFGPVQRADTRAEVVGRPTALLRDAVTMGMIIERTGAIPPGEDDE